MSAGDVRVWLHPEARIKVACVNWSHPEAPHAVSYLWDERYGIRGQQFHPTWGQAMARADRLRHILLLRNDVRQITTKEGQNR